MAEDEEPALRAAARRRPLAPAVLASIGAVAAAQYTSSGWIRVYAGDGSISLNGLAPLFFFSRNTASPPALSHRQAPRAHRQMLPERKMVVGLAGLG
jgi:hypothetical protein